MKKNGSAGCIFLCILMTSEYEEEAQNLELQISTKTLSSENILRALWSIYVSRRVFSLFWNPSYL